MKRHLKFIFFIAALTACGIILCQLYWVFYNYNTARTNFIQSANYSLKQSIDKYQLSQNKLPTSLKYKKPTFTFFMRTIPDDDPIALDTPHTKRRFSAEFATVAVDKDYLPQVKSLVARLMSQQKHRQLNLDTLGKIFQSELMRSNIKASFRLSIERNGKTITPGEVAAIVNFYKDPFKIKAELKNQNEFLFNNNFAPALVSSLLIILSAGSLFYMGTIIKRQMLLDSMKTDFINNITHELRTPLTILKSSNEAMAKFGAAEEPASLERYLNINAVVLEDLDTSIERILEFSKSEQGNLVPNYEHIDFQHIVSQSKQRFSLIDHVIIQVMTETEPFEIMTDKYMLGIILINLLDNAIKYSPGAAHIVIKAKGTASKWQLQVSDQGQGIPKSRLPYIFDKFYRVGTGDIQDVKGYGIGLTYVRQLVTALKGKISVNSEVGKGTTFTINFNL